MTLRSYQAKAVDNVFEAWEEHNSVLIVMPTGTGKTRTFSEVIRRRLAEVGGRAMVLAHREEIVKQNSEAIKKWGGIGCDIEMADSHVFELMGLRSDVVSSSVQTQITGRMNKFKPDEFTLLVVDEAHHATAKSWQKTIDYYRQNPKLKVLGVTATPDRADEEALGKVFDHVAFDYEILDAINEAWLVPIEQQVVQVKSLDFSSIHTVAGDFNQGELSALLEQEENTHGMAYATLDTIDNRSTVVYCASVKQAELFAEILNRHSGGIADFITGKTPKERRQELLSQFSSGKLQVIVNCGVLTEGWDAPRAEVIVLARPTKSRALYAQMVGRGLRPLPELWGENSTIQERQTAIAISPKPKAIVLDFEGNAGRHKLMSTADILGGKYSDDVVELAKSRASVKKKVNMEQELQLAFTEIERDKAKERQKRAKLLLTAQYQKYQINPFDAFHIEIGREKGWEKGKRLSLKQKDLLSRNGFNPDNMTFHEGSALIGELMKRRTEGKATFKQVALLSKHIENAADLSFNEASERINSLAQNNWRHV